MCKRHYFHSLLIHAVVNNTLSIPMAAQYKAQVRGRSIIGIAVRTSPGPQMFLSCVYALCRYRPLRRVQRSPIECACARVCVSLCVIRCNNKPLHLQWDRQKAFEKKKKMCYVTDRTISIQALNTACWPPNSLRVGYFVTRRTPTSFQEIIPCTYLIRKQLARIIHKTPYIFSTQNPLLSVQHTGTKRYHSYKTRPHIKTKSTPMPGIPFFGFINGPVFQNTKKRTQ